MPSPGNERDLHGGYFGDGEGESVHCDANATPKLNRLVYDVW